MQDRDHFDATSAAEQDDRQDGQPDDKNDQPRNADRTCRSVQANRDDQVLVTQSKACESQDTDHDSAPAESDLENDSLTVDPMRDDPLTIERLIDDHSRFLFGYAYRLANSISDAEDLTQQTFLIAHQKLDQLRSRSAAKSWLCAILRSCWLKSIRRNQPKPASGLEIELSEILMERENEIEFDSQAVQIALQDLPPDYRLVLLMYYFEDLSYQEIAEKLNVKMGTVMSRLSRAKDRVRSRLKNKDSLLDK